MHTPPHRTPWLRLSTALCAAGLVFLAGTLLPSLRSRPPAPPPPPPAPVARALPLVLPPWSEPPREIAWGPDGRTLAIGGERTITLWGLDTGAPYQRLVVPFTSESFEVRDIGWSPDRTTFFARTWHGYGLWSTREGFEPYPLLRGEALPGRVALDPTGTLVAHAGQGKADVHLLDARTGALRGVLAGSAGGYDVDDVSWSPDGKLVAVTRGGAVLLFEVATARRIAAAEVPGAVVVHWSPEGDTLVAEGHALHVLAMPRLARIAEVQGSHCDIAWHPGRGRAAGILYQSWVGTEIGAFDLRTGRLVRSFVVGDWVDALALSPDGARLVIVLRGEPTAQLHEAESGELLAKMEPARWPVRWHPDGARFATSGGPGSAFAVWSRDGALERRIPLGGALRDVTWAGGSALLVRDEAHGALRRVDLRGPSVTATPSGRGRVSSLAESPDHRRVAVGRVSEDGYCFGRAIEVWSVDPWQKEREFAAPSSCFSSDIVFRGKRALVAWSPDGRLLASTFGGDRGDVSVWDTATWTLRGRRWPGEGVEALAFRPDGRGLVAGVENDAAAELSLIDAERVTVTQRIEARSLGPVIFSPRGDRLVWGTAAWGMPRPPPSIEILQAPFTGTSLPIDPGTYVASLAWSADDAWIAAGHFEGEVSLWDVATRERRALPMAPGGASVGVAFRPGDAMLAASGDHIVLFRPRDGAALALHDIPVGDRLARLVHTDTGLYDGDAEALPFLRLRVGEGATAAIVSSGPLFESFRRPGLLQAFLEGR